MFKVGSIFSFSVQSLGSSPKVRSFKNFSSKTVWLIFFRISQKVLNIYISLLVKFDLVLLDSFLTLGSKVDSSASALHNQLCHHKFHVISLATMFLCPKIASK